MAARSIWSPLRTPDYRRLWLGQSVSVVGDKVNQIAMGVMVYQRTGSLLQMGVMLGVTMLPAALFAMFAGVFVDRWDRRWTMIASDVARAALVVAVPFAASVRIELAYAVAFLVATVSLFFDPAKAALIPELVPPAELMAANSLDSASSAGAELFGLAFAGPVVALLAYRGAFYLDAATYLVSALFVFLIAHRQTLLEVAVVRAGNLFTEVAEGLRYIRETPVLRDLMGVYSLAVIGGSASITMTYLLALRTYSTPRLGDAMRLALLDTAITAGLLLGSVAVGRGGTGRAGAKFLWGLTAYGVLFAGLALAPGIWAAMVVLLLTGVANMYFQIPMATMLQQHTHSSVRGRVFAARLAIIRVFSVCGLVGAGAAAERLGVLPVVAIVGAMVLAAGLFGWTRPALQTA